jgi:hypothetical protein
LGEVIVEYAIPYLVHKLMTAMGENIGGLAASFNDVLDVVRKLCGCSELMFKTKTEVHTKGMDVIWCTAAKSALPQKYLERLAKYM